MIYIEGDVNIIESLLSRYMVTTGMDAQMKVWDIRQYKPLHGFYTHRPASSLDISQRGLVALGYGTRCEVRKMTASFEMPNVLLFYIDLARCFH